MRLFNMKIPSFLKPTMASVSPPIFWLKTAPHPLSPSPSKFTNLYLRHASSGSPSVVLTPAPPKFLRSHLGPNSKEDGNIESQGSRIILTTWRPQDAGREWGLLLEGRTEYGKGSERVNRDMWAPVHIQEGVGIGDTGFSFAGEKEKEVLVHEEVKGWVVCPWALGHPQLFWLTDAFEEGKLPDFCDRVDVIREEVIGQIPAE
jgi:hypothetical protein